MMYNTVNKYLQTLSFYILCGTEIKVGTSQQIALLTDC